MDVRGAFALGAEFDFCTPDEVRQIGDDIVERVGGMFGSRMPVYRGQRRSVSIDLDSNGDGVGEFSNDNMAALYVIRRVSGIALNGTSTTLSIWHGLNFVDTLTGVDIGASWVANDAPLYLRRGEDLRLEIDGGAANGTGIVSVFFDEVIEG